MTEKRFQYIRGKYSHGVHDTVKDGEHKKGYRTTYDEFDLDKLTDELNIRENKIKQLEKENEQLQHDATVLIQSNRDYRKENESLRKWKKEQVEQYLQLKNVCNTVKRENEQLKKDLEYKERVIKQYQQSQEENMKYCEGDVE